MNGKNRIMIFGPKDDGTYVVGFRTAVGEAPLDPAERGGRDPALPGAHALRAVRAGSAKRIAKGILQCGKPWPNFAGGRGFNRSQS